MSRHRTTLSLMFFVGLGFLASCEGCSDRVIPAPPPSDAAERYATALCEAEAACECGHYSSIEACETDVIDAFEAATTAQSSFDGSCFDAALDQLEHQGCAKTSTLDLFECAAITGHAGLDEPCERDPRLRAVMPGGTCKTGTTCNLSTGLCAVDGTTVVVKMVGDACVPHHPMACGLDLYCAPEGGCQPRSTVEESCMSAYGCEPGAFCEGQTGSCAQQLETGQSCDPNDTHNCAVVWTSMNTGEISGCNPQTLQCEPGELYVCWMLDFPVPP